MSKISVIVLTAIGVICTQSMHAKPVTIPINDFQGKFSEQFILSSSPGKMKLEQIEGKETLKIEEDGSRYCAYTGINLDGFKGVESIYLSIDIKTVNVAQYAVIYYFWLDKAGKKLTQELFLKKVSGSSPWTRFEEIITSPQPLQTGGIRIGFSLYTPKGSKNNGWALFRDPLIRIATPPDGERVRQSAQAQKKSRSAGVEPTAESFELRFTNKLRGVSFDVERGGFGWLMLWAKQRLKNLEMVRVSAPETVEFELYLGKGEKAAFCPSLTSIKNGVRTSVFSELKHINWQSWMNVLLFKAAPNSPDQFDIVMDFCDASGKVYFTETIPIKTIVPTTLDMTESSFENRVYYAHPFRWIDFNDKRAKLANGLLDYLKSCGFTSAGYLCHAKNQPFMKEKGEVITNFARLPYRVSNSQKTAKLLKKHNISMAMNIGGIRSGTELETQALINNGVEFYLDTLKETGNSEYLNQELVWINDYEPYAFEGPALQYSFAPESLASFREFIGLDKDAELTPGMIAEKYVKQWVKFRCQQHAMVIKAQYEALKKFSPQAVYALSSESLPGANENQDDFFKEFGVDLRMMDLYTDLHLPMIYSRTTLFYHRLEACIRQLRKPVMPTITCGYGNSIRDPQRLTKLMVGSAFLGAPGVYHWPGFWGMDANELQSCRKAMNLIAKLEPYIKATELLTQEHQISCADAKTEQFYYAVRGNAGEYMVFMVNDDKNKTFYPEVRLSTVTAPLYVTELVTNQAYSPDREQKQFSVANLKQGFHVKLPPDSIKVFYFSPKPFPDINSIVYAADIKNEYNTALKKLERMNRGTESNGMSYKRTGDILEIVTPVQKITLQMNNCAVGQWQLENKGKTTRLLDFFGINYFDYPAGLKMQDIPVELENIELGKDAIRLTVYFKAKTVPYAGLAFRQKLTIFRDSPEIKVEMDIIPTSGFKQFALRVVCGVNTSGSTIIVDGKPVAFKHQKNIGGDVFVRKGTGFIPYVKSRHIMTRGDFDADKCTIELPGGQASVSLEYGDKVKALMNWYNIHNMDTIELIYEKAYKTNDPHQIKTWNCTYTLKAFLLK